MLAVPENPSPSVVDALDTTDNVPSAVTAGVRVTVSPMMNPFVLATAKFRGVVVDEKDMFEEPPCVTVVPVGTEYGYVEKTRLAYAGPDVWVIDL